MASVVSWGRQMDASHVECNDEEEQACIALACMSDSSSETAQSPRSTSSSAAVVFYGCDTLIESSAFLLRDHLPSDASVEDAKSFALSWKPPKKRGRPSADLAAVLQLQSHLTSMLSSDENIPDKLWASFFRRIAKFVPSECGCNSASPDTAVKHASPKERRIKITIKRSQDVIAKPSMNKVNESSLIQNVDIDSEPTTAHNRTSQPAEQVASEATSMPHSDIVSKFNDLIPTTFSTTPYSKCSVLERLEALETLLVDAAYLIHHARKEYRTASAASVPYVEDAAGKAL